MQSGHDFDQDDLRQALRRAFPAEQAPSDLRKRVAAMLRNEEMWTSDVDAPEPVKLTQPAGPIASPIPIARLGNFFQGARRVALAACFAGLTMGIALFVAMQTSSSFSTQSPQGQLADVGQVPPYVQAAVVRHDELIQPGDPTRSATSSLRPMTQVRTELQKHIATPMPEADFSPQGWQLVGGKTWQAGGSMVAQIFYRRGRENLSVFILPPDAQGRRIQMSTSNLKDHLVATREAPNFTVCVVGSSADGKLTTQEVDRLADVIASH